MHSRSVRISIYVAKILSGDFLLEIPGHEPAVFLLQVFLSPILAGDDLPAVWSTATAVDFVGIVVGGCPIVSQLFSRSDLTHCYKYDLTLHANVRIAGMIAEDHAAFTFLLS